MTKNEYDLEKVCREWHFKEDCLYRWIANEIVKKFLHEYDIGYAEREEEVKLKVEGILGDLKPFLMERMSQVVNGDLWHKEYGEVRSGMSKKPIQNGLDAGWEEIVLV